MLENLAVAVIVLLAAVYAGAKYLPANWRRRVASLLARRGAGHSGMARWLNAEKGCGGGCDACTSCAEPAPPEPGGPAPATPPGHRVIKLHRRP